MSNMCCHHTPQKNYIHIDSDETIKFLISTMASTYKLFMLII